MVSSRHINHPEINDSLSERLLKRYVEIWDPQKLYFLQSDIDEFSKQKTSLDDEILRGDVQFAATCSIAFDPAWTFELPSWMP
jgi:carboxyl-terminal processing protease